MTVKVYAQKAPWNRSIEFMITESIPGVGRAYGTVTMKTVQEAAIYSPDPSFRLEYEEAQALMDELWTCGIRPSEGSGSAGALAATERHLADMRRLVFETPLERNETRS